MPAMYPNWFLAVTVNEVGIAPMAVDWRPESESPVTGSGVTTTSSELVLLAGSVSTSMLVDLAVFRRVSVGAEK